MALNPNEIEADLREWFQQSAQEVVDSTSEAIGAGRRPALLLIVFDGASIAQMANFDAEAVPQMRDTMLMSAYELGITRAPDSRELRVIREHQA